MELIVIEVPNSPPTRKEIKENFLQVADNFLRVAANREFSFWTLKVFGVLEATAAIYGALCYYSFLEFYPLVFALPALIGIFSLMYSANTINSICEYSSVESRLHEHLDKRLDVEQASAKYLADVLEPQKIGYFTDFFSSLSISSHSIEHNRDLKISELREMLGLEPVFRI